VRAPLTHLSFFSDGLVACLRMEMGVVGIALQLFDLYRDFLTVGNDFVLVYNPLGLHSLPPY